MSEPHQIGQGPLSQLAGAVYRHLALAGCLAVACLPTVVMTSLLDPAGANAPLFVLAQVFVAPAASAGLYAVRGWRGDEEAQPLRLFLLGYRRNAVDVLRWWVPALALLALVAFNYVHSEFVIGGAILRPVGLGVGAALLLAAGHCLVISSYFSFRTRDVMRLGVAELFWNWRVTLVYGSLLIVAAWITFIGTEIALLLLAWAFVSFMEFVSLPVSEHVRRRFTVDAPA